MRLSVLLAAFIMLAVLLSPAVLAEDAAAFYMVVTYPDGEYDVGSEVDLTVHVFDRANYVDVDAVTVMVGSFMGMREVNVTEQATGKWAGTFTIEEDDVLDMYYRSVMVAGEAEVNGTPVADTSASITLVMPVETEEMLVITNSLDPPGVYMSPGETKTLTWKYRYDGELVDPDEVSGQVYEGSNADSFAPEKVTTGVYKYEYTMPNGPRSVRVDFDMSAVYTAGSTEVEGENDIDLFMNFFHTVSDILQFFQKPSFEGT